MTPNDQTIISDDVELKELLRLNEKMGKFNLKNFKLKSFFLISIINKPRETIQKTLRIKVKK